MVWSLLHVKSGDSMDKKDFELKVWGGVKAKVIGKCKYCKMFSFAEIMVIDEVDKKPYHPKCKDKHERELANEQVNLREN